MSDDNGVVWEEPPGRGGKNVWVIRLEPLMARPGAWARVRESPTRDSAHTTAHNLSRGKYHRPPGRWEFTSRGTRVYARYLGPEEEVEQREDVT